MPTTLGRKGHKGRGKQFSNPEEIDRQMKAQRELVSVHPLSLTFSCHSPEGDVCSASVCIMETVMLLCVGGE